MYDIWFCYHSLFHCHFDRRFLKTTRREQLTISMVLHLKLRGSIPMHLLPALVASVVVAFQVLEGSLAELLEGIPANSLNNFSIPFPVQVDNDLGIHRATIFRPLLQLVS